MAKEDLDNNGVLHPLAVGKKPPRPALSLKAPAN
jgi:hypothetical protein